MDTDRNHPQQEILVEAEDRITGSSVRCPGSHSGSAEGNAWGSSAGTEPENPRF